MKFLPLFLLIAWSCPPPGAAADPAGILTELETRYAEDRAVALRLVLARYADDLEKLQRTLLETGDASGAARVQLERDRILPALGLPVVAAENADEFAAFEEPAPAPPLPAVAPAGPMGNLEDILKTLRPPSPKPITEAPAPGMAKPGQDVPGSPKDTRRVLRMGAAQLLGSYDPVYGYVYWSSGRSASWTLNDLPPGSYRLHLRYACDDKEGGGKLQAKFGGTTLEAEVPPTGNWKRKRDLTIGPFEITASRVDLKLQPVSLKPGALYLMDLTAVLVLPADAPPP